MRTPFQRDQRGSLLIIVMGIVGLLAVVAISVLDLSMNTYRLSMRNELRAQARAVAESELDYMLYQFKMVVVSQTAATASVAPAALSAICDNSSSPTTVRSPFLAAHSDAGWTVRRSMMLENAPFTGTIPGTTKVGTFTYITARVEVIPPASSPFADIKTVRVGRRFINSNTTLFQFSIFFQGDLELNPGSGDTVVNGDVVANGSIYMGPAAGATLKLNGKVRYLASGYFNTTAAGTPLYFNPGAKLQDGVTLGPPIDANNATLASGSAQLETLDTPENLLGGIDAASEAKNRPDLFGPQGETDSSTWTEAQLAEAENNVYRSLIVPPPSSATTAQYPNATSATADDNVISVRRAYTRADLVISVEPDGTVSVAKVVNGVSTDVTAQFGGAVTAPTDVYDEREAKQVSMTKLDVGALKTALDAARAPAAVGTPQYFDFQGLLYVNLKGSSSTSPGGIKLTNATSVPFNATTGTGFSVATNGGVYIQGSYNTTPLTDAAGHAVTGSDGQPRAVPAMLIGDALTLLSTNWVDSTTTRPLSGRVAGLSTDETSAGNLVKVNAGLLTGNTASTTTTSSGGAQNLVRYLEDWSGKNVTFNGSLGRLFNSTNFTSAYGGSGVIYKQPTRNFSFDANIPTHPPPGNPTTTAFGRGDFFTW
jgi:Tfp pilus assembly protein PilX